MIEGHVGCITVPENRCRLSRSVNILAIDICNTPNSVEMNIYCGRVYRGTARVIVWITVEHL